MQKSECANIKPTLPKSPSLSVHVFFKGGSVSFLSFSVLFSGSVILFSFLSSISVACCLVAWSKKRSLYLGSRIVAKKYKGSVYMPLNRCFTASSSVTLAFVVFTPLSVLRLLFNKRIAKLKWKFFVLLPPRIFSCCRLQVLCLLFSRRKTPTLLTSYLLSSNSCNACVCFVWRQESDDQKPSGQQQAREVVQPAEIIHHLSA